MFKTGFLTEGFIQRGNTPTPQEVGSNELKLTLDSWEQLPTTEGRGGQLLSNATNHSLVTKETSLWAMFFSLVKPGMKRWKRYAVFN